MSAFAALRTQDAASMFFTQAEDEVIAYQPNSSDNESDTGTEDAFDTVTPLDTVTPPLNEFHPANNVHGSNFSVTEENCIINDDYIMVGLDQGEHILVVGQLFLSVLKGSVLINQHHYILSSVTREFAVTAPQSQSLPTISCTDTRESNISTMSPPSLQNFKTVIKLRNHFTGLENLGTYHAPFKRFFTCKINDDDNSNNNIPKNSFEIVIAKSGFDGLTISKSWSDELKRLSNQGSNIDNPQIIMIIGNKNSGKSTFSKALLNELASTSTVSYLDLDPGQSEFSPPYCLTLSTICSEIFGMNLPSSINEDSLVHYFGFTTPLSQPELYMIIVKTLINKYLVDHKPKGNHLIINTPGWVKGYGKELLQDITDFVNPSTLVLLSSSLDSNNRDNLEILNGLRCEEFSIIPGIFQTSKYSASQLRTINKLLYFHYTSCGMFNFESPLLATSPKRLSYRTSNSSLKFLGVNSVSIFNFEVSRDFEISDLLLMIDSSIVGMYAVEDELYHSISPRLINSADEICPDYMNFSNYLNLVSHTSDVHFMGLCMVHSIDVDNNSLNLYQPEFVKESIVKKLNEGFKLLLVKGEGEIPNCELLNKDAFLEFEQTQKLRKSRLQNKNLLPFITLDGKAKNGGIWKIRRNVMRRGQQN